MNQNFIVPTHAKPHKGFELRATKQPGADGTQNTVRLHRETSKARIKRYLFEELPNIFGRLSALGWLTTDDASDQIVFEIIDLERGQIQPKPINSHPIHGIENDSRNLLWFAPKTKQTLRDLRRYQCKLVGRLHFEMAGPNGTYVVDLEACSGHGACSCPDFEMRRSPFRETARQQIEGRTLFEHQDCIHLKHMKFLLGRDFGAKTMLSPDQVGDPGQ
jgi:hypothetical protein